MIFVETSKNSIDREIDTLLILNDQLGAPSDFIAGAICSLLWIANGQVAPSDFFAVKDS